MSLKIRKTYVITFASIILLIAITRLLSHWEPAERVVGISKTSISQEPTDNQLTDPNQPKQKSRAAPTLVNVETAVSVDTYYSLCRFNSPLRFKLIHVKDGIPEDSKEFYSADSYIVTTTEKICPTYFRADDFLNRDKVEVDVAGSIKVQCTYENEPVKDCRVRFLLSGPRNRNLLDIIRLLSKLPETAHTKKLLKHLNSLSNTNRRHALFTDNTGCVELQRILTPVRVDINVLRSGFVSIHKQVVLNAKNRTTQIDVNLSRAVTVAGRLWGLNLPIAGAKISVVRKVVKGSAGRIQVIQTVNSNSKGDFQFPGFPIGNYELHFSGFAEEVAGSFYGFQPLEIRDNKDLGTIHCLIHRISGQVVDSTGNPVSDQVVSFRGVKKASSSILHSKTTTDEFGKFKVYTTEDAEVLFSILSADLSQGQFALPAKQTVPAGAKLKPFVIKQKRVINLKILARRLHGRLSFLFVDPITRERCQALNQVVGRQNTRGADLFKVSCNVTVTGTQAGLWVYQVGGPERIVASARLTMTDLQERQSIPVNTIDRSITARHELVFSGVSQMPESRISLGFGLKRFFFIQSCTKLSEKFYLPRGWNILVQNHGNFRLNGKQSIVLPSASPTSTVTITKTAE